MVIKPKILLLIFLSSSLFLSSGISAEESLKEKSTDSDAQEYVMDELTVTGQRPLYFLKMEVIRAEELQLEIFNSLNSTDEFDITCEWRARLGTRFKQRVCDVGYMKKARSEDFSLWYFNGQEMRSDIQLSAELAHKAKALKMEWFDLAYKHPELAAATIKASIMQRYYEEEQIKRNKGGLPDGDPKPDENDAIFNEIDMWAKVFLDHKRGAIPDDIWERWDSWCRTKIQKKSYRALWEVSANRYEYSDDFVAYINTIMSGD